MPMIEWYLQPYNAHDAYLRVQIDPARISGYRGTFGPALTLPYSVLEGKNPRQMARLISLEGRIGWSDEADHQGKLRIPSQTHQEAQPQLEVSLTDEQIDTMEQKRNGGQVFLTIALAGVAVFIPPSPAQPANQPAPMFVHPVPVHNMNATQVTIPREQWLSILQQLGVGTRRLVELPEPRLPRQDPRWAECLRLLEGATQFYRRGEYEQALIACRQVVEGIPQVLCAVWGLSPKRPTQAYAGWLEEVKNRLVRAWPQDQLTPDMLRTLLGGAWTWLAPAPHYNTGIPLREDAAFALGLCTDLLLFAGQALQAHPNPLVVAP